MGDSYDDDGLIGQLVGQQAGGACRVLTGPVWLMVLPTGAAVARAGWKLHVSTRVATFPDLVRTLVPVLAAEGCAFKLARSQRVLADLNEGFTSPASVGKAVTIYPDQHRVRELGLRLAGLLQGWPGPRVLSDRRVDPSAPVYYRYGPFTSNWESDSRGKLVSRLHGPGGQVFDAEATLAYRQPAWQADPFTGEADGGRPSGPAVLGDHYRVTAGLRRAAPGNVYRATDMRDGTAVVVKQARALVAEYRDQIDARMRLRNERRVLTALDGVPGVPRLLDHFQHGDDEFLVTADCGPASLPDDLLWNGIYRLTGQPRSLGPLATALARILDDLHSRGVIMRDLSPKNIVVGETGVSIVDFGIAALDGLHLPGATPGYAPARQRRDEPPTEQDDYFALGMTLLFATSGLDPVSLGEDPALSRVRALQAMRAAHGPAPTGLVAVIAGLLSDDPQTARGVFHRLIDGTLHDSHRPARPLPAISPLTAELAAEISGALLADLLSGTGQLLNSPPTLAAAHDASIYSGSSGIGLELLHHLTQRQAAPVLTDLAAFTVRAAERVKPPPGLFTGVTGVSVFLQQAASRGISTPVFSADVPAPDWRPAEDDLIFGAAGVGLGHLLLYQADGGQAHLDAAVRCGHAILGRAAPPAPGLPDAEPAPGIDPAAGQAHGLAGVTQFLIALARQTGDQSIEDAASQRAGRLAGRTRHLLRQASPLTAAPLAMSWCQGLAGIGPVLLHAGTVLGDPSLTALARSAADACIAYLPRISMPGRCCGAAGIGNFLIDLAIAGHSDHYWQAAYDTGTQLLLRSAGSPGHHVFLADSADRSGISWAFGITGLLCFFRRLANGGGPDSTPTCLITAP